MPNYKLVNADQLDSDLALLADTIRAKAQTDASLTFPYGMAETIVGIQSDSNEEYYTYDETVHLLTGDITDVLVGGHYDTPQISEDDITVIANDDVITYNTENEWIYVTALKAGTAVLKVSFTSSDVDTLEYCTLYLVVIVEGGPSVPVLYPPTIALNGNILTITPPTEGDTPELYRLYASGYGVLGESAPLECDLSTVEYNTTGDYEGEWKPLPIGNHTIYARACILTGGAMTDSECVAPAYESENSNTVIYEIASKNLDETIYMTVGETKTHGANYDVPEGGMVETGTASCETITNDGVVEITDTVDDMITFTALKAGTAQFRITASNYDVNNGVNVSSDYTLTIVVTDSGGGDTELISFYVDFYDTPEPDGVQSNTETFEAESGMTFLDWLNSDYAPSDAYRTPEGDVENDGYPDTIWFSSGHYIYDVDINDVIGIEATYQACFW